MQKSQGILVQNVVNINTLVITRMNNE